MKIYALIILLILTSTAYAQQRRQRKAQPQQEEVKVEPEKPATPPLVPGFGEVVKLPAVLGFGGEIKKEEKKIESKKEEVKKEEPKKVEPPPKPKKRSPYPEGIPDWFVKMDKDKDGQVTFVEYMGEDDSGEKAQEFVRYDSNNDGVITSKECLKVKK